MIRRLAPIALVAACGVRPPPAASPAPAPDLTGSTPAAPEAAPAVPVFSMTNLDPRTIAPGIDWWCNDTGCERTRGECERLGPCHHQAEAACMSEIMMSGEPMRIALCSADLATCERLRGGSQADDTVRDTSRCVQVGRLDLVGPAPESTAIPAGTGWFCYGDDGALVEGCHRDEDSCKQMTSDDPVTACPARAAALCYTAFQFGKVRAYCYPTIAGCEERAGRAAMDPQQHASVCAALP